MGDYDGRVLVGLEFANAPATMRRALMSRPESVFDGRLPTKFEHGPSEDPLRFFSPPEKPSLTEREASLLSSSTMARFRASSSGSHWPRGSVIEIFAFGIDCRAHEVDH